jgi:DNA-binding CsgD family transcriptional regulator
MSGRPMTGLTARQAQVAELVAAGLTTEEVARRLGVTRDTIKNTKTVIYRKLGVRNNVELANKLRAA